MSRVRSALTRLRRAELWFRPTLALCLAAVLLVVGFAANPLLDANDRCSNSVACGYGQNVAVTVVAAAGAYWWLIGRKRNQLFRRYRRRARVKPADLLADGQGVSENPDPTRLCDAIDEQVSSHRRRQTVFVLGGAGSGRSAMVPTLLRSLNHADRFAVAVDLDDADPLALLERAETTFISCAGRWLDSPDEAGVIWRRLIRSRRLVVVADGFDEWRPSEAASRRKRSLAAQLLRATEEADVVLFLRPEDVPSGVRASKFHLPTLAPHEACEVVLRQLDDQKAVPPIVVDLINGTGQRIRESPFRLKCLADLVNREVDLAALRNVIDGPCAAVPVLRLYIDAQRPADADAHWLRGVATAMLWSGRQELDRPRIEAIIRGPLGAWFGEPAPLQVDEVIDAAAESGFIVERGSRLKFENPDLAAMLAGEAVGKAHDAASLVDELLDRHTTDEIMQSIVWATSSLPETSASAVVGSLMVRWADVTRPPSARVAFLDAVVQVSTARQDPATPALVSDAVATGFPEVWDQQALWRSGLDSEAMLGLADALGESRSVSAIWPLLALTHNARFSVRWRAAQHLTQKGPVAAGIIAPYVHETLAAAEASSHLDSEPGRLGFRIAVLGWLLPSFEAFADDDSCTRLLEIALAPASNPMSVETSLIRGLKLTAARQPHQASDLVAQAVGRGLTYWYSRVNAAHALAHVGVASPDRTDQSRTLLERLAHDQHPLVAAAAQLCMAEITQGVPDLSRCVWSSEAEVISSHANELSTAANQLVADVALLQNLIYRSDFEREDATLWATSSDMPWCMTARKGRTAMTTGCPPQCAFNLCRPGAPPVGREDAARGAFSESFCRLQRDVVKRRGAPAWQRDASGAQLKRFWDVMATEAGQPEGPA